MKKNESFNYCYGKSKVNLDDKITITTKWIKRFRFIDKNSILEITNTDYEFNDRVKGKSWKSKTIDSLYYGKDFGINKMKQYSLDGSYSVSFNLVDTLISSERPVYINCFKDEVDMHELWFVNSSNLKYRRP